MVIANMVTSVDLDIMIKYVLKKVVTFLNVKKDIPEVASFRENTEDVNLQPIANTIMKNIKIQQKTVKK